MVDKIRQNVFVKVSLLILCIIVVIISTYLCYKCAYYYNNPLPVTEMEINYKFKMCSNNGVGNDWSYLVLVNDTLLDGSGTAFEASPGDEINIYFVVVERDEAQSDIGYCVFARKLLEGDFRDGIEISDYITVREDRGRYSGNVAVFQVESTLKAVRKSLFESIRMEWNGATEQALKKRNDEK